jgi:hypothetical protein
MKPQDIRICVDVLSPVALRERRRAASDLALGNATATRAIAPISSVWPNGTVLHARFLGGTAEQRKTVELAAKKWEEFANLKLVFDDSPQAQIRVAFEQDGRSWSYVGTDNLNIPAHAATMNFGWPLEEGTILHEFGHAIGLAHEHQNPDGGLKWNEAVVLRELAGPPNSWDEPTIRFNVLDKYRANQVRGTKFDPDSIMLYAFPARWTTNGVSTKENDAISQADQAFVGGSAMYPFPPAGGAAAVVLTVAENPGVEGGIGKPGEVNLYRFTAKSAGLFTIVTEGATDVFMRLFGPNSTATLIAEDDDSAGNRNPRIVRQLAPGDYFVQIRHFSPTQTGKYRIKVSR